MRVEVVYGAPCSGKSTYVRDRLKSSDVVYDYDHIIRAMTNRKKQTCEKSKAHMLAIHARGTFIRYLPESGAENAYIITRYPTDNLRKALAEFEDVTYTAMETSKAECLSRLQDDNMRPDKEAWEAVIEAWFQKYGDGKSAKRGEEVEKATKHKALKVTKADSEADIGLINQFTVRQLTPEEVYTFNVVLCDNEVDRDYERFTDAALSKLAEMFVGKTGIFDHNWTAHGQTARIYRAEVQTTKERTATGDRLKQLVASAYMLRSEQTKGIIDAIDAGILKEVSVGVAIQQATCSICGAPMGWAGCDNGHVKGTTYDGKLCCGVLDNPTDAYEFSFVAVPAQPGAGVTKSLDRDSVKKAVESLLASDNLSEMPEDVLKSLREKIDYALLSAEERQWREEFRQYAASI